jgi:hypothetical protein
MARKTPKKTANRKSVDLGQVFDDNVRLLAKSSEIALSAYVDVVKALTDRKTVVTAGRLVQQAADGWKDALIQTTSILRNAYVSLGREIK